MSITTEGQENSSQTQITPEDLPKGFVLSGRYEIERVLGIGGMSTVYLANDKYESTHVAVKVLKRDFVQDETYVERFQNEVAILSKIHHPNVIQFSDSDKDEATGFVYYAMEHVEGESLYDLMERKRLSSAEVSKIVLGICDGLGAIHKCGIIHRDLKPENILIDGEGVVKITDFGVARDTNSNRRLTTKLQKVGSMNYMAPERWVGSNISESSDLYALGVMLYQMAFGDLPFKGDTVKEIMDLHLEGKLEVPDDAEVTDWVKELIVKLLEKDYRERPQSAQEVINFILNYAPDDLVSEDIATGDAEQANLTERGTATYTLMLRATRNISCEELGWDKYVPKASVVIKLPKNRTIALEVEKPSLDFLFLGLFLISLLAMDGILTSFGISGEDIHLEGNPIVAYLMGVFGKNSALIITKTISIIFVIFITLLAKRQRWIKNTIAVLSCIYLLGAAIPWLVILHYSN